MWLESDHWPMLSTDEWTEMILFKKLSTDIKLWHSIYILNNNNLSNDIKVFLIISMK